MLLRLNVDILWTHLFPLLSPNDLYQLYNTHRNLRPAIDKYKDWEKEYLSLFNCDHVVPPMQPGFSAIIMRLNAVVSAWGVFAAKMLSDEPYDVVSQGLVTEVYHHNKLDTRELGHIRQFLSDRIVLLMDGRIAQYSSMIADEGIDDFYDDESDGDQEYGSFMSRFKSGWVFEKGWPDNITKLCSSDSEAYFIDGNSLYHQQVPQGISATKFSGRVIAVEFLLSQVMAMVEGVGIISGWAGMDPSTFELVAPDHLFPVPMVGFCMIPETGYALISESKDIYVLKMSGIAETSWADFPCKIKSVHMFNFRCEFRDEGNGTWTAWSGLVPLNTLGFVALGENGKVYYYDSEKGVISTPIPNLSNIIKIVTRNTILMALDKCGHLFFMGSTEAVNPGAGFYLSGRVVANHPEILGPDGKPDVLKILEHPEHVYDDDDERDIRTDKLFYALPRPLYLDETVVDFNIYGRQVSYLGVPNYPIY